MSSIIFFDGVCNLCNSSVDFVIKRDRKNHFLFASLQSTVARDLLGNKGIDNDQMQSIILLSEDKVYYRSDAALEIAKELSNPWPLLYAFKIIPRFIRDAIYKLIANNRYNWFGKRDTCRVPTMEERNRFLEEPVASNQV